jgi:phage tail-like protein
MPDNRFLPAFHFTVQCSGLKDNTAADTGFESVTGLQITAPAPGTDADKKLPAQYSPVVLKRAVSQQPSPLRQWVLDSLNGSKTTPLPEVLVQVLDETHQPAITIRLINVTAAGWQLCPLTTQQSELLMEEITLQYSAVEWLKG